MRRGLLRKEFVANCSNEDQGDSKFPTHASEGRFKIKT